MKANKIMITQAELKDLLTYNSDTGIFNWIKRNGNVAGYTTVKGYVRILINYKLYPAHRLAWLYVNGSFPNKFIDHINHVCDDNRIINLREATVSQNAQNQIITTRNTSGFKGVSWDKRLRKWRACIVVLGKTKYLGCFIDKKEAHQAYCKAADEYHKEFANHG
jgi:hypothetical protein